VSDELPQGWAVASLAQLTSAPKQDIVSGPFGSNLKSEEYVSHGVPIIRLQNVDRNRFLEKNMRFITKQKAEELSAHSFKAGDIVISKLGDPVGKACVVPTSLPEGVVVADVVRVRLDESRFSKPYAVFAINSPAVISQINQEVKGSTRPRVNLKHLRDLQIPLAPPAEQRRIVAKLEQVLGKVDACQGRLAKIPVLLKRFRRSVLAAACAGRLTADWRNDFRPVPPKLDLAENFEKPYEVPETWRWTRFGTYVENHDGKRVPIASKLREARRGKYPYYGASGVIDTIDGFTHDGEFLLIGEDGANLLSRSTPIAFIASGKIWVNNHAHVLRCRPPFSSRYLCAYVNSIDLSPYVTGTAQPKLNQANMNQILLPVPPADEQNEIVRRVEALFALADKIEARYAKAQAQVDRLTPSLLARAFAGKLVAQNPADEPASILLQQIRAQKPPVHRRNVLKLEFTEPAPVAARLAHTKGIFYRRAALDCYVISALAGDANLGRTKLEKISHLLEYECGLPLEREPIRDAAGPNDYPSRLKVESMARKQAWYFASKQPDGLKIDYRPGPAIGKSLQTAVHFIGDQKGKVDALLAVMRPLDTRQSEIVATLYASWNDFLLAGKMPTDDELVDDVRNHWHPKKLLIPVEQWTKTLAWMRRKQLVPRGSGRPVRPGKAA
jgi:type I restriction enzyme S subunit